MPYRDFLTLQIWLLMLFAKISLCEFLSLSLALSLSNYQACQSTRCILKCLSEYFIYQKLGNQLLYHNTSLKNHINHFVLTWEVVSNDASHLLIGRCLNELHVIAKSRYFSCSKRFLSNYLLPLSCTHKYTRSIHKVKLYLISEENTIYCF